MNKKIPLLIFIMLLSLYNVLYGRDYIPLNDTIILLPKHVEGRWIETNEGKPNNIYLFKEDSTFFKAVDNPELLIFNVSGWYTLCNDTIKIIYQDMSRRIPVSSQAKLRTVYLKVIALSGEELNIDKTENGRTNFIRLKREDPK